MHIVHILPIQDTRQSCSELSGTVAFSQRELDLLVYGWLHFDLAELGNEATVV